ncbi:hypothetical protein SERLADRAFT_458686 [Serpula lacrymans var. lacrymans S7.9]|uniref:Retrovirus-related Pol polyprotein from transposon TNT 1-94-like beta-barrel domain-containing protein n=1 Tax=Serpula lacrymans var. lacrymans (strain S7.9) TaxID=578457 RepID=F8NJY5_SERL9|nr:uncharacterized protein SERLADRAFT_458686 [Serpula lacrymans var. lacrymans S7.9]EGO28297.1 hypothetical protein SERLADRAFT_458686 [Serpula lacrymans var. lacrymans S7.9]
MNTDRVIDSRQTIELYDLGATTHFTPYQRLLKNYIEIPPQSISAANQNSFPAMGKGDLMINVPNGDRKPTKITL